MSDSGAPNGLNPLASEAGKLDGMERAELGAPDGWVDEALDAIRWVALRHPYVVSDDLWARGLAHPPEPRALGPCFIHARRMGLVEPTKQFVLTVQASRHRAPIRVWRSRLYGPGDYVLFEDALYSRQVLMGRPPEEEEVDPLS